MSIIGQSAIFNITDEYGEVKGEVKGIIQDKVRGVRKVINQLPQGTGKDGNYWMCVSVDFYILKTDDGIVMVEATQYLGHPSHNSSTPPFIGYP